MKKILKLGLIFILVAGGLFFIMNLDSLLKWEGPDFAEKDQVDIKEQGDRIRHEWDEVKHWDEALYQKHHNEIEQFQQLHLYSETGYETVTGTLRVSAINAVNGAYMDALKVHYSHNNLRARYEDVKSFSKYEDFAHVKEVETIRKIHNLYTNVRSFTVTNKDHTLSSAFNPSSNPQWESFSSQKSSVLKEASGYRNNPLFKEIAHIPGFRDGLNEASLTSLLDKQKMTFFQSLGQSIKDCYKDIPATKESAGLLNEVVNKYSEEYSSIIGSNPDYGASHLEQFYNSYAKQVPQEEE